MATRSTRDSHAPDISWRIETQQLGFCKSPQSFVPSLFLPSPQPQFKRIYVLPTSTVSQPLFRTSQTLGPTRLYTHLYRYTECYRLYRIMIQSTRNHRFVSLLTLESLEVALKRTSHLISNLRVLHLKLQGSARSHPNSFQFCPVPPHFRVDSA
jgi:hypothetical protein